MATPWFIRGNGKVYGPLDSAQLQQLVAQGKIDQTTEVAQNQNGPWVAASKVKGLFGQAPITASYVPQSPMPAKAVSSVMPAVVATTTSPAVVSPGNSRGGYVESNLLPGEQIVYRAHLHWFCFFRPALWFVAAVLFWTATTLAPEPGARAIMLGGSAFFFIAGVFSAIGQVIAYKTSEFAVTNRRVIMKQGFIRRKTMELMLAKVDSLSIDQGIFGRLFGFGTVRVTVATEKQNFPFLHNPLEFRRQVQLQATT